MGNISELQNHHALDRCTSFTFSFVLFVVLESNYKFIYASVGANGATCDAQVFYSSLYQAMVQNDVGLRLGERLPEEDKPIPYFMVGLMPSRFKTGW